MKKKKATATVHNLQLVVLESDMDSKVLHEKGKSYTN